MDKDGLELILNTGKQKEQNLLIDIQVIKYTHTGTDGLTDSTDRHRRTGTDSNTYVSAERINFIT
jgi:hypothetical protein